MPNQYLPGVIAIPSTLLITNITRSNPMVVTVSIPNSSVQANTYIVGMSIRLFVPQSYGMIQANNIVGTIIRINGLDFSLNWDSSQWDAFIIPPSSAETPASIAPFGSRNLQYDNTTDAVPFQSLNNIGN